MKYLVVLDRSSIIGDEYAAGANDGTIKLGGVEHESRVPGKTMEVFANSADAYYHGYIGYPKWYLAYPPTLFEALLRRLIASFRTYLSSNSIDPYSLVEDKARW